ncbi:MAG: Clp domain protein [Gemmatimonadetes bacterium]|nr:Clp domain protein [Gemmatimonadota bacterium]
MSSTDSAPRRGEPIAREARPLPSAPSLEYERKQAKALLRQIRAGDADSLRRVRSTHPVALRDRRPDELKLADAQHVIAREYGFASWPRLVEYFEELERHRNAPRYNSSDDGIFEERAQGIVRRHQRGDPIVARELAHFVPRFYARPIDEILATPITEDEARLVVARERRRVSWDELNERANAARTRHDRSVWDGANTPFARARSAMRVRDVDALSALLDEHPELLTPSIVEREWRQTLAGMALHFERESKSVDARRITELLASRGVDVQRELDEQLLGWPQDRKQPETVRWNLDRGANPNWMPPNGITVLEHAIVRYDDGRCVDLIAERVTPRRALWIAAGLGDVAGVRSFVARKGTLTRAGRLNRPDTMAMGKMFHGLPPHHDADDLEIMWEAFQIAGWNERWAAMDALLDAGLPIDHAPLGMPLVLEAVGNLLVPLAEYLVSRGADLDRQWLSYGSARALAQSNFRNSPQNEEARRLLTICNAGTPEKILAELDATRQSPPPPEERTLRAMQLAADDAARQGQAAVTTENMLVGLLRVGDGVFASFFMGTGTDMPKLRAMIGARLLPDGDPLVGQALPPDAGAEAAVRRAATEADSRRRARVGLHHLLHAILSQETGPGARLLGEVGTNQLQLRERLTEGL